LKTLIIIVTFIPLFVFSQTKKDSILNNLKTKSIETKIVLRKSDDSTKTIVYKFCEDWSEQVSFLKSNLTGKEISELKLSKNSALKLIGIICDLENENTKASAIKILNQLIDSKKEYLSYLCNYDVISTKSLSSYVLKLISEENNFFNPNFLLNDFEN
jgi:hypothetical protein